MESLKEIPIKVFFFFEVRCERNSKLKQQEAKEGQKYQLIMIADKK